jgi:2-alkyl-3-oxoalkanoate reductase
VTGASGFVGRRLADALAAQGQDVLGFGRRPLAYVGKKGWRDYRHWDLTIGPLAVEREPEAVVHCAAMVADWGPETLFERTNVDGTRAVLASFPRCRRFVHLSSASVYDPRRPKRFIREDAPLPKRYLDGYSLSKRRAESVVLEIRPDAVVLRPHAVYGPGDPTLMPRLLAARRAGRLLAIGNGRNHVSLTHVDNLIQAVALSLRSTASGIFNVADRETPTLREIMATVNRAIGGRGVIFIPRALASGAALASEVIARVRRSAAAPLLTRYAVAQLSTEYTLDISRARTILRYQPARSYQDAIQEVIGGGC